MVRSLLPRLPILVVIGGGCFSTAPTIESSSTASETTGTQASTTGSSATSEATTSPQSTTSSVSTTNDTGTSTSKEGSTDSTESAGSADSSTGGPIPGWAEKCVENGIHIVPLPPQAAGEWAVEFHHENLTLTNVELTLEQGAGVETHGPLALCDGPGGCWRFEISPHAWQLGDIELTVDATEINPASCTATLL